MKEIEDDTTDEKIIIVSQELKELILLQWSYY